MARLAPERVAACILATLAFAWSADGQGAQGRRGIGDVLDAMSDASYIGGMPPEVSQLAEQARNRLQSSRGAPLAVCDAPDPLDGSVVATGVGVNPPAPVLQDDPVLRELQSLLRHPRRFVRDASAFIAAEIGPAAVALAPDLAGDNVHRSPWFTHALARISCTGYAMQGGVESLPAGAGAGLIDGDDASPSVDQQLQLVARLLQRETLRWPDGFFASFIDPWELREQPASLARIKPDAVIAIVDRVVDTSAPRALRADLLNLLDGLDEAASPAADQLLQLANGPDDEMAFSAARMVMDMGRTHALDAAGVLLDRFNIGLSMVSEDLCSAPRALRVIGPHAMRRLAGRDWSEATAAATWLGCLDPLAHAALLRSHLDHPGWETRIAVIAALSVSARSDETTRDALRTVQRTHWSGLVRQAASESLDPPAPAKATTQDPLRISLKCFHRCVTNHLRRCGDSDGIVDGLYISPSMGELDIVWQHARRVPTPDGFPIAVAEDERPDYGTSTYLRVADGWLYGADRWHYGGVIGFVDDKGNEAALDEWGEVAVAFVDTPHFGPVMLGGSTLAVGDGGLLSQVRHASGKTTLVPRVALPSPPWGWALAPNGTLLVADPYEAVAVLEDGSIESLACPARGPTSPPRNLLAMAKTLHPLPELQTRRDADADADALQLRASAFASQSARHRQLQREPGKREVWETPANLQAWLDGALDEWLDAFLVAGRADAALRALASVASDGAAASPDRRFQVHAAAGQPEQARMQLANLRGTHSADALKLQAMLALADGRAADAIETLGQHRALVDKSIVTQREDPYLPLLHGLASGQWPTTDASADDASEWPAPIHAYLAGRSDEKTLVLASHTRDGRVDREKLCEALFFSGLKLVSEGKPRRARAQFRAAAALQVQHFHEHAVAMTVLDNRAG